MAVKRVSRLDILCSEKKKGVSRLRKTVKEAFELSCRAIILVLTAVILVMTMCPMDAYMEISEGSNEKSVLHWNLKNRERMLKKDIIQLKDALDEKRAHLEILDERLEDLGYQYARLLEKKRRIDSLIDTIK